MRRHLEEARLELGKAQLEFEGERAKRFALEQGLASSAVSEAGVASKFVARAPGNERQAKPRISGIQKVNLSDSIAGFRKSKIR